MGAIVTQAPSSSDSGVIEELIAERRLWTAVLVMAVEDWRAGTLRARRAAQKFLFEDNYDFDEVCAGAGLDPGALRSKLQKIGRQINLQDPWMNPIAA